MQVTIEKLDNFGRGITWIDGKICFVPDTLPNEIVDISIIKTTKKYLIGKLNKFNTYSKNRIINICPYAKECGGCDIMHANYNFENKFKQEKVKELVTKFTKLDSNIVKEIDFCDRNNYRNKITLHSNGVDLGLYKKNTNEIIPINNCFLVTNKINKLIKYILKKIDIKSIDEIMIREGNKTHELMLSIKGKIEKIDKYYNLLEIVDVLIINSKVLSKNDKIISYVKDKKYYVSEKSFFQINNKLTEKLYDEVLNAVIENKSRNVLDLYCGTGTIGIYISDYVNKVYGIEIIPDAIRDAFMNKRLNDTKNISFKAGKVENLINNIKEDYDTIIIDPPRSGLDKNVILNIKRLLPATIIYVSCDPVTLMRDINNLNEIYDVKYIKPFNMFPNTYHVECVSVLQQKT